MSNAILWVRTGIVVNRPDRHDFDEYGSLLNLNDGSRQNVWCCGFRIRLKVPGAIAGGNDFSFLFNLDL